MDSQPPSTPPSQKHGQTGNHSRSHLTPEEQRRIVGNRRIRYGCLIPDVCAKEVNHLKAKAIREQREVEEAKRIPHPSPTRGTNIGTGVKRSFASMSSPQGPATLRDGRTGAVHTNRPLDSIRPARNFAKYVEYDFSKMTDTKGGFLTEDDDPYNKALYVRDGKKEQKPAHITQKEWDRHQLKD